MLELMILILIVGVLFKKITIGSAFAGLLLVLLIKFLYDWRVLGRVQQEE